MRLAIQRLTLILVLLLAAIATCEASNQLSTAAFRPRSNLRDTKPITKRHDFQSPPIDVSVVRGGVAVSSSTTAMLGCLSMVAIEKIVKRVLQELGIQFPAMLGGCIALFLALLTIEKISPAAADASFSFLKPGADLVAKWFSMLFVPGLVLLPLSPSIGSNFEVSRRFRIIS